MRTLPMLPLLATLSLAIGCTAPEGVFHCEPATVARDCPSGWSCVGGRCYSSPDVETRDAGRDAFVDPAVDAFVDPSVDAFRDDAFTPPVDAFVDPTVDAFMPPIDAFTPDAFVDPSVDAFTRPDAAPITCAGGTAAVRRPDGGETCAVFGGFYIEGAGSACPGPNPFIGPSGAPGCACPAGFMDFDEGTIATELGVSGTLHSCLRTPGTTTPDWGGFYIVEESGSPPNCRRPNARAFGCTCPSGYVAPYEWRAQTGTGTGTEDVAYPGHRDDCVVRHHFCHSRF